MLTFQHKRRHDEIKSSNLIFALFKLNTWQIERHENLMGSNCNEFQLNWIEEEEDNWIKFDVDGFGGNLYATHLKVYEMSSITHAWPKNRYTEA